MDETTWEQEREGDGYDETTADMAIEKKADPHYYCACGWFVPRSQLIWSVPRGYICPNCKGDKVRSSSEEIVALRTELAAAIGDLIMYRRNRYADTSVEEVRYRELTGKAYDEDATND